MPAIRLTDALRCSSVGGASVELAGGSTHPGTFSTQLRVELSKCGSSGGQPIENAMSSMHAIACVQLFGSAYKPSFSCAAQKGNNCAAGDGAQPVTFRAGAHAPA